MRVSPTPKPLAPAQSTCSASHVAVKQLPGGDGAAGTIAVTIRVTNVGSEACMLRGYPSFTLAGGGRTLPAEVTHGNLDGPFDAPVTTVTLAPGDRGGFLIAYGDVPRRGATSCAQATRLALVLPDGSATGDSMIMVCGGRLTVSPYLPESQLGD